MAHAWPTVVACLGAVGIFKARGMDCWADPVGGSPDRIINLLKACVCKDCPDAEYAGLAFWDDDMREVVREFWFR